MIAFIILYKLNYTTAGKIKKNKSKNIIDHSNKETAILRQNTSKNNILY